MTLADIADKFESEWLSVRPPAPFGLRKGPADEPNVSLQLTQLVELCREALEDGGE